MQWLRYDTLDSTNDEAKRLLRAGRLTAPACILADEQTAGRGTHGRAWASPRGAGLYLSVVHTGPGFPWPISHDYTRAAAVACAETLADATRLDVRIKPINDLYVADAKLGGILIETTVEAEMLTALITGVGINIRRAQRILPPGVRAVSLEELLPPRRFAALDLAALARRLAERIDAWQRDAAAGRADGVLRAFNDRLTNILNA
jgi:BirA family biotin operon repressor/biotin-[acetyl-CoA-carboxylase] ligase